MIKRTNTTQIIFRVCKKFEDKIDMSLRGLKARSNLTKPISVNRDCGACPEQSEGSPRNDKAGSSSKNLQTLIFLIVFFTFTFLPSGAEEGRPPSAFGVCCCKKGDSTEKQITYSCKIIDEAICPENTKLHPGSGIECPTSLIINKYKK